MKLQFIKTTDKSSVEKVTRENMHHYYQELSIDWDSEVYENTWREFETYEIISGQKTVGYFRVSTDDDALYIRDIQILKESQNGGIGTAVIGTAEDMAAKNGRDRLRLRVFRTNPAIALYESCGFTVVHSDERTFSMEKKIA
jgi:ribosomal protein S18 acetylase RimI-like enzyme